MKPLAWLAPSLLLVSLIGGCGEGEDLASPTPVAGDQALVAPPTNDMLCPLGPATSAGVALTNASNARLGSLSANDLRPVAAPVERIRVHLSVEPLGSHLLLRATFRNPFRCAWYGDLFVERELPLDTTDTVDAPGPNVETLARRYGVWIPGGGRVRMRMLLDRPPFHFPQEFVAKAYASSGADQEIYDFCIGVDPAGPICAAVDPTDPVFVADEVLEVTWEEPASSTSVPSNDSALIPCVSSAPPPLYVNLTLRTAGAYVQAMAAWQNATRIHSNGPPWVGDLYVDLTHPSGRVDVLRQDLRTVIPPATGFCTWNEAWLPATGVYAVTARALRRDGGDRLSWQDPGTTEIYSVCNRDFCESMVEEQEIGDIVLTGDSAIWLYTDFFSEYTRVTMEWEGGVFDITERCTINQYIGDWRNFVEVRFDTMNLPIGPGTWANYTVELNPMPAIPEGAKLTDSMWLFTNGAE